MNLSRRAILIGGSAFWVAPGIAGASTNERLLQNRLELWANYARRTKNMMARLITTRETSLLDEPLVSQGSLVFDAPSTLLMRDDGLAGSSTLIQGDTVTVRPTQPTLEPPPPIEPALREAERWLAGLLLRLFSPPPAEEGGQRVLVEGLRYDVPRRSFRLELMPARGSIVRKTFRSVTVHLDPVVGTVTQVLLAQTQGDRLRMQLTDHRQNVDQADIDAVLDTVRDGSPEAPTDPASAEGDHLPHTP